MPYMNFKNDTENLMKLPGNVGKMKKYKEAIRNRDLKGVKRYFKIFKFNIYEEGVGVRPALHYAVLYDKGNCDIIRFLVDNGEDVERYLYQEGYIQDQVRGFRPLYGVGDMGPLAYAVVNKRADAVVTLLELDANPYGERNTRDNPMTYAALLENEDDAILYTFILLKFDKEEPFRRFDSKEYINILTNNFDKRPPYYNEGMEAYAEDYFFKDRSKKSIERRIKFLKCAEKIYGKLSDYYYS